MQSAQLDQGLFGQGLELMLYGMGMVVVFLVVLVYATRLLSHVVIRFFPEPIPSHPVRRQTAGQTAALPQVAGTPDPKLIAAAVAAVHAHRQRTQE